MPASNLPAMPTVSKRKKRVPTVPNAAPPTPVSAATAKPAPDSDTLGSLSSDTSKSCKINNDDSFWSKRSNTEERQHIREFWLRLREDERRSLVRIEKEAVLKRMKEQQRHSCNCSVCGKKRTAIENELEVLYDAYYEELKQSEKSAQEEYDDHGEDNCSHDTEQQERPSKDGNEAGYKQLPFHNDLAVKGGLLTVADDLLRNNGKKFLDMMERLAERRIRKESDFTYLPNDDGDDDDVDDDDGYYDGEDDDREFDEEDLRTGEQRVEEGRRMFHIFAARMFEQRVLAAYREKIAQERQQRLLEELEEEERIRKEREAKRSKEKERKKDKKRQLRKKKEDERLAREAQKKLEEEKIRAEKERMLQLERQKRDQERRRREEEKLRREEERFRKLKKERERAAEKERKRQERELKEKQERVKREEREWRERQFKEEKERRERELKEEVERRDRDMEERKLRWEKEEDRRKAQQKVMEASAGSSSSLLLAEDSESSPRSRTTSISPIGVPPNSGNPELSKSALISPATENSFFSNFLIGETSVRVRNSYSVPLLQSEQDLEQIKARTHTLPSSDTPKTCWTNGWTASSLLSEDVHGRLFGDILPGRNAMILERAKVAYRKLNDTSKTPLYMGFPPPFHTLTQVYHMMNDMYSHNPPVNIQELYQAMVSIPSSPFRCNVDPQHGVLVYLYEPMKSNSRHHMSFAGFSSALFNDPLGQQHHHQHQPQVFGPMPLFKGIS
ncbi:salt tolerance down-regulator-domain-containing protein [Dichotomocladium elegans]|nr:salt tolerance down-regulator-domain-containing protein [Dichotomocladium elegans]